LIAAVAINRTAQLFTNDGDFRGIAEHTTLRLLVDSQHQPT
jgi:predicted nucleic acid-binding protein